uniref:MYND-type domain-containing protein n=1 Tax=Chromera velia CCMP2878 TaxID=1169474 RepID=A0A0G4H9R4_9ALVE|eukprot:Cvel_25495.t1-p1 / transcript=Cvel_25495.t1 / gene=Cvel_25495 / organism=Chromera_velia_CCMP2878 / gene_product=hypothetical protein / transcript_product=hypothetical protein / location=Cvel_scaffold2897:7287-8261(-) / protein_length=325 / sequence_SO=supercontig / SO=protein_coding / is_pseudo=false
MEFFWRCFLVVLELGEDFIFEPLLFPLVSLMDALSEGGKAFVRGWRRGCESESRFSGHWVQRWVADPLVLCGFGLVEVLSEGKIAILSHIFQLLTVCEKAMEGVYGWATKRVEASSTQRASQERRERNDTSRQSCLDPPVDHPEGSDKGDDQLPESGSYSVSLSEIEGDAPNSGSDCGSLSEQGGRQSDESDADSEEEGEGEGESHETAGERRPRFCRVCGVEEGTQRVSRVSDGGRIAKPTRGTCRSRYNSESDRRENTMPERSDSSVSGGNGEQSGNEIQMEVVKLLHCAGCHSKDILYCGSACQRRDWREHKKECQTLRSLP